MSESRPESTPSNERRATLPRRADIDEAAGLSSAAGTAECRQRQRHDHARCQAPAPGDRKADRKREGTLDLFR